MKKFLINLFVFFVPVVIGITGLLSLYIVLDPFQILYDYNAYFTKDEVVKLGKNKDFISTTTFVKNITERKFTYNSFIFGNSRSIFYEISDWKKYIGQEARCYHFDASGEGIFAIGKKIEFVKKMGQPLDRVLLILDQKTLQQSQPASGNHLFLMTPVLLDYKNILSFHFTFLRTYLNPKFLLAYYDYKIFGKLRTYMIDWKVFETKPVVYDVKTNEVRYEIFEKQVAENQFYTPELVKIFYKRDSKQQYGKIVIKAPQKKILNKIKALFDADDTEYKIVINPLYDQIKLNPQDLDYLRKLFGKENVFDYSGINDITDDYKNYYETSHYRPVVTKRILKEIYSAESSFN